MNNTIDLYEDKSSLIPKEMVTYFVGLLRKGPAWSVQETVESRRIQDLHLSHIRRMFEAGDLVIAGPFEEAEDLRGAFIFRTATKEEARSWADADPAVQAGRLIVDLYPWRVPSGILP